MKQINHLRAFCETVGQQDIKSLFPYQLDFLLSCLVCLRVIGIFARQTGKTTMIALFSLYIALQRDNFIILIIAPTDRQAGELFTRIANYAKNSGIVAPFIENCTLREIRFTNGSVIRAMPTGDFGDNIRGQTADLIILEESSYIKTKIVNQVIMPMIASKGEQGRVIQIGTPFFKNHFYEASLDEKYAVHQYDYMHCPMISEDFIDDQKKNLTTVEFTMEYLAKFIDETDSYFSNALIEACKGDYEFIQPLEDCHPKSRFFLGVDFARMGQDKSVFIIIEKRWDTHVMRIADIMETKHKLLTDAIGRIQILHQKYRFEKIYLDETGMGAGPSDVLKEKLGAKIEPITFTMKSKQDIFGNLKVLFENGKLQLPEHKKLIYELLDLKYEITSSGNMKIHHSDRGHDDYADALALACYYFRPKREYIPTIA